MEERLLLVVSWCCRNMISQWVLVTSRWNMEFLVERHIGFHEFMMNFVEHNQTSSPASWNYLLPVEFVKHGSDTGGSMISAQCKSCWPRCCELCPGSVLQKNSTSWLGLKIMSTPFKGNRVVQTRVQTTATLHWHRSTVTLNLSKKYTHNKQKLWSAFQCVKVSNLGKQSHKYHTFHIIQNKHPRCD